MNALSKLYVQEMAGRRPSSALEIKKDVPFSKPIVSCQGGKLRRLSDMKLTSVCQGWAMQLTIDGLLVYDGKFGMEKNDDRTGTEGKERTMHRHPWLNPREKPGR
jgi:hypothetical protein